MGPEGQALIQSDAKDFGWGADSNGVADIISLGWSLYSLLKGLIKSSEDFGADMDILLEASL